MYFKYKEKDGLEVKGYGNIYNTNRRYKNAAVSVLLFERVGFKAKIIIGNNKGNCIVEKASIYLEDTTIIMTHSPNN